MEIVRFFYAFNLLFSLFQDLNKTDLLRRNFFHQNSVCGFYFQKINPG